MKQNKNKKKTIKNTLNIDQDIIVANMDEQHIE
jgi:hypothetical protein